MADEHEAPPRDLRFWLIFISLSCCTLLSALDQGGVGTAAPTIVHALNGSDFTWVSAASALSSAASIPLAGNLAQTFGRRDVVVAGIILFAIGSAVSGSASSLQVLIVGRVIQGAGGGTMQALTSIIISDLIPLRERGVYAGISGMLWTLGSVIGPLIAGSLSEKATWRWLFYLNLPLAGIALAVVILFLKLNTPQGSMWEKIAAIDWVGNALITASACSCMLALTWGGTRFAWSSPRILVPLILGVVGLGVSLLYEWKMPKKPTIPIILLSNRNSLCGYIATFLAGIITFSVAFYIPTWFQSVKLSTPIFSGLEFLPLAAIISPLAIVQGIAIKKSGKYRLVNGIGWCFLLLGLGLMISLNVNTSFGLVTLYQLITGTGMGLLYATTFAVLAPLPVAETGPAVALQVFIRTFSQAWGVSIGGTILQNALVSRLPDDLVSQFPGNSQIAYFIIPLIPGMDEPQKSEVREAFLMSLRFIWICMISIAAVGLITFLIMRDVPLRTTVDKKWGIQKTDAKPITTEERDVAGATGARAPSNLEEKTEDEIKDKDQSVV